MVEKWNSENMIFKISDEYKHLTEIAELINLSGKVTRELRLIYNSQNWHIQCNSDKNVHDFNNSKSLLLILLKLINE